MRAFALLFVLALSACADPFEEAKKADTIEAWDGYLAGGPTAAKKMEGEKRLEELMLDKARADHTLESYDALLKRFPKGKLFKDANQERQTIYYATLEKEDTPEGWQKFLDEYKRPKGDPRLIADARRRVEVAKLKSSFEIADPAVAQVNLAEDPKGPLDGWGFTANVTNKGDKPIEMMYLRVILRGDDGKNLLQKEWPVVAKRLPGNLPFAEGFDKPIAPGETRKWEYATGDAPEGWNQKFEVLAVRIKLEGAETPADAEDKDDDKGDDKAE